MTALLPYADSMAQLPDFDCVQDRAEMSRANSWASMAAWGSFTASANKLAQLDKGVTVMGSLELDFKEVRV